MFYNNYKDTIEQRIRKQASGQGKEKGLHLILTKAL